MAESLVLPVPADWRAIPWRRIWGLLGGSRRTLLAMVALSLAGSLCGLLPPLALGFFVDGIARGSRDVAFLWLAAMAAAVLLEAGAYVVSDGLYARVASRLNRDLRALMFAGALHRGLGGNARSALAARFVSDAETLEELTVAALDQGAMAVLDFTTASVALGLLGGWLVGAVGACVLVSVAVMRRLREPAAHAARVRHEELEGMSHALGGESTPSQFREAVGRVAMAEARLGWIGAANRHGNLAIAGLGPVAVLVTGVLEGGLSAGTLLSSYLIATRVFVAVEAFFNIRLDVDFARGPVARCFALVDAR